MWSSNPPDVTVTKTKTWQTHGVVVNSQDSSHGKQDCLYKLRLLFIKFVLKCFSEYLKCSSLNITKAFRMYPLGTMIVETFCDNPTKTCWATSFAKVVNRWEKQCTCITHLLQCSKTSVCAFALADWLATS